MGTHQRKTDTAPPPPASDGAPPHPIRAPPSSPPPRSASDVTTTSRPTRNDAGEHRQGRHETSYLKTLRHIPQKKTCYHVPYQRFAGIVGQVIDNPWGAAEYRSPAKASAVQRGRTKITPFVAEMTPSKRSIGVELSQPASMYYAISPRTCCANASNMPTNWRTHPRCASQRDRTPGSSPRSGRTSTRPPGTSRTTPTPESAGRGDAAQAQRSR